MSKDKSPKESGAETPKHELYERIKKPLPMNIRHWLTTVDAKKALDFKMTEFCGDHSEHQPDKYGCDFDKVTTEAIVSRIEVFLKNDKYIEGYKLNFKANPSSPIAEISRGIVTSTKVKKFDVDTDDKITNVTLHAGLVGDFGNTKVMYGIGVGTARAKSMYLGVDRSPSKGPEDKGSENIVSSTPHTNWSFKGLWFEEGSAFDRMGIFYGKDAHDPVEKDVVMWPSIR